MSYYFNKVLKSKSFNEAIAQVTAELKKEGFGVLTEIDIKKTLKNKIDVDFKNYIKPGPHPDNKEMVYKALESQTWLRKRRF